MKVLKPWIGALIVASAMVGCATPEPTTADGQVRQFDGRVEAWDDINRTWVSLEQFWLNYAGRNGGLTWGRSAEYPPYDQVAEHDTFMVELESGPCLMEFFHERWRRANDVRRWDEAFNDYGGCPYVFD